MADKDDKSPKPVHAPIVQIVLRPGQGMGAGADRQDFAARQAKVGGAQPGQKPPLTPEQRREARVEQFKSDLSAQKDHAFNGERPRDRAKGTLSAQHDTTQKKGGPER